jgi:flap endonuclease-1
MGIRNLNKFIKENISDGYTKININDLEDKVVAIDTSLILYQFLIAIKSTDDLKNKDGKITSHIHAILTKVLTYLKKHIYPIFVFDGKPPEIKTKTLQYRNQIKKKALDNLKNDVCLTDEDKKKMLKRSLKITEEQIKECKEILSIIGIPYIESPTEADPQCAYLVKEGIADSVISDDMDLLAFGTSKLIRGKSNKLEIYNLNIILKELKLTYDEFVELCILFGCDYCDTIKKIGVKRAYELILKYKNIESIIKLNKYDIPEDYNYKAIIDYFKNPPILKIKKKDIKWLPPKLDLLKDKLINDYDYNPTNVTSIINTLENGYYSVICGNIKKANFKESKKNYLFTN